MDYQNFDIYQWKNWVVENCFSESGEELLQDSDIARKSGYAEFLKFTSKLPRNYTPKMRCWYVLHTYDSLRPCPVCGEPIIDSRYWIRTYCCLACKAKVKRSKPILF